eukprot:TRINITY_DN7244_c0_g1_i1.p2 TRINITY_DN7244_c0_g1~~TRINITY_DN7244_c0_g1_i1.p2  ORF type:complete len:139 (+),score=37.09 TRINITY_DN7244_c0_g1_i1:15-431(+)
MNSYKVFVNTPKGDKIAVDVNEAQNVNCIKATVCEEGFNFNEIALVFGGKQLEGSEIVRETGIVANANIEAVVAVKGGAAKKVIDPVIAELARKYRLNKKVCRKCYALLNPKSTVCRKRRCGHWADLRMKKTLTDAGK